LSFDNSAFLFLLIIPAVLIPIAIIRYIRIREKAALFAAAAPSNRREPLLRELRLRIIMSDIFFLFFLCLLIVALAGPRWGVRIVADYRRGLDVVLAFDVSRSMNVRDCPPHRFYSYDNASRLERGIGIARELVGYLEDVRFGTAISKGKGILAVPLTFDSEMVMSFLYVLDSQAVTGRGTDLESLLDSAIGAFQESIPSCRGIILFSDGENLSGSFQRAVNKARKAGISLSAVGLGSDYGGPVPVEKGPEAPDGFLLGANGKAIWSERHEDVLRNAVARSGGIYVDGSQDEAARVLAAFINSLSADSRLQGQRREANPRWRFFIIAAMACLGGARLMGFSRRSRRRGVLPVLLCLFTLSSCSNIQGKLLVMEANFFNTRGLYTEAIASYLKALNHDEAIPYAEYGLASVFSALDEGEAALDRYIEAEKFLLLNNEDHPELRYRIHYNMGIIYFENEKYAEAIDSFKEALKVDGSRIEAKRNLELSLLSRARSNQPQGTSSEEAEDGRQGSGGGSSVIFEYLKAKEQEQWKSREWIGENSYSGPDY
jgi:Ca-activated chloride channel family protein